MKTVIGAGIMALTTGAGLAQSGGVYVCDLPQPIAVEVGDAFPPQTIVVSWNDVDDPPTVTWTMQDGVDGAGTPYRFEREDAQNVVFIQEAIEFRHATDVEPRPPVDMAFMLDTEFLFLTLVVQQGPSPDLRSYGYLCLLP